MAGGKKPVNIFRLGVSDEPQGVFNWRLWFAVISFALLGAARGVDEGLITGVINSLHFKESIHYDNYDAATQANIKANIAAGAQLGSIVGAWICFIVCDKIGRIWATRILCMLWLLGTGLFALGAQMHSLPAIYVGRAITGLGIGQTAVVGPIYLAEVAPDCIRGLCTCFFTSAVYIGIILAYFTNYACRMHLPEDSLKQWVVPVGLHVALALIILIVSLLQLESPRYLVKDGRSTSATRHLACIRGQPVDSDYIKHQISTIQDAINQEYEATKDTGFPGKVKHMFSVPSNRYRVFLAIGVQVLAQWSGAAAITLYAPDLFQLLKIGDDKTGLLFSGVFGITKLIAALITALFLVDVIGRKRSMLLGIALQTVAMVYVAIFFTLCPGITEGASLTGSQLAASRGAIAMLYLAGVGFALGWHSMQYLLTAEMFPIRIRALAASLTMTMHFSNQFGICRAVPVMLLGAEDGGIAPSGTFWSFAVVSVIGGIWVCLFVPETSGWSLEKMDTLFELPWYKIGLYGRKHATCQEASDSSTMTMEDLNNERREQGANA